MAYRRDCASRIQYAEGSINDVVLRNRSRQTAATADSPTLLLPIVMVQRYIPYTRGSPVYFNPVTARVGFLLNRHQFHHKMMNDKMGYPRRGRVLYMKVASVGYTRNFEFECACTEERRLTRSSPKIKEWSVRDSCRPLCSDVTRYIMQVHIHTDISVFVGTRLPDRKRAVKMKTPGLIDRRFINNLTLRQRE